MHGLKFFPIDKVKLPHVTRRDLRLHEDSMLTELAVQRCAFKIQYEHYTRQGISRTWTSPSDAQMRSQQSGG